MGKYFPGMHKALASISSTVKSSHGCTHLSSLYLAGSRKTNEFKAILDYIVHLRPGSITCNPVSKYIKERKVDKFYQIFKELLPILWKILQKFEESILSIIQ